MSVMARVLAIELEVRGAMAALSTRADSWEAWLVAA